MDCVGTSGCFYLRLDVAPCLKLWRMHALGSYQPLTSALLTCFWRADNQQTPHVYYCACWGLSPENINLLFEIVHLGLDVCRHKSCLASRASGTQKNDGQDAFQVSIRGFRACSCSSLLHIQILSDILASLLKSITSTSSFHGVMKQS